MNQFQVTPPEKFTFRAEDWTKWIKRFERFRIASGLETQADENQVNTLIYTMGDEAEDILVSLHLTPQEASEYETVKGRLDAHFVARRNIIFERAKFNQRQQETGESIDGFHTALHCLAEYCGYGTLHDEMVRDRFVVGLRDKRLSEQLQMDAELTLEKALNRARQSELVKKQQEMLHANFKSDIAGAQLDRVHASGSARSRQPKAPHKYVVTKATQDKKAQCRRCGDTKGHSMQQCPAREAACNYCGKKGHFARVCRNKKICQVNAGFATESTHTDNDVAFLGSLSTDIKDNPWMTDILVDKHKTVFKIDTGADVTAVPETLYSQYQFGKLDKPKKILQGPGGTGLKVKGMFTATLSNNSVSTEEDIYVVKDLCTSLLSGRAAMALKLVARVNQIGLDSIDAVKQEFPKLFTGLGLMEGEYNIVLSPDAQPFSLSTPRRISLPLLPKVKEELNRMQQEGVITKVEEPTDWCAPMVVVPKSSGKVRICIDLTELNKYVMREKHPLPSVEHTLGQLAGAKVFSKLDANAGFWQIPLSRKSSLLTTFITPFGRYCYNRLCFGISSAPEHFQKRMTRILEGLDGVLCQMDDVLIWGTTQQEHDERLRTALFRLQEAKVTLNDKCEFSKRRIKFLGQVIDASGVSPDPDKVSAIRAMEEPRNISEVRRFLGMVNHLGKFLPHLAEKTRPLRDLLKKSNMWSWGPPQQQAFDAIKTDLTTPPGLALYDPNAETCVSADASSYGLGAVLLQKHADTGWRPVAYASRSLSDTEQRYAQIEKEALASTWACERFAEFLTGKRFHIETDHKPLVPLLGSKCLNELPPRIQRLRMRLMRFSYSISHVAGKNIATADVLSRAPIPNDLGGLQEEEINLYVDSVVACLPATEPRLREIQRHQDSDSILKRLKKFCVEGWPDKFSIEKGFQPYLPFSGELTVQNGLLLYGSRIVIPASLRKDILSKLHEGHLGITKCRERAKHSVWWPGLSSELIKLLETCDTCCRERTKHKEPLLPTEFPQRPWAMVGADLFQFKGKQYLMIVDYFSRFFEVAKLTTTTSEGVIEHCKSIFARHGIPERLRSDNGPQFASDSFSRFAQEWGFSHETSSPNFPQSNGEAERAVRTTKNLLKKAGDPYLALMAYRSAPLANGFSPTELLMGRRIRTTVPVTQSQLTPKIIDMEKLRTAETDYRQKQRQSYNRRHRARNMSLLHPGEKVWVTDLKTRGTVVSGAGSPRSYIIETPRGMLRRNSYHLSHTPGATETSVVPPETSAVPHETLPEGNLHNSPHIPVPDGDQQEVSHQTPPPESRVSLRSRRPPAYLDDYICS
uniref:Gypsy retrotransposon integrase-like protein 1 n=1 Tax=Xiphophorus maculatus TaxID=8083 RepID=A0A3B5QZY7_XIPMA